MANQVLPPPLLTERDAARFICMSVYFLRQARVQGRGPEYMRFGRSIRYRLDALEKFIQQRTVRHAA
jgi:hypothetical protein